MIMNGHFSMEICNNIIIIGGLKNRQIYNTMHILDTRNNLLTVSEMVDIQL